MKPPRSLLRGINYKSHPGSATTVSDDMVPGLDPTQPTQCMDFVDPRRSEPLGDGTIRAPRLGANEVFERDSKTGV